jgi:hypothetical protein
MSPDPSRHFPRFILRTLLLAVVGLLAAYFGCYYRISRKSMVESAAKWGVENAFFYFPLRENLPDEDIRKHHRRAWFFAPTNWIDRTLFGGPSPYRGGIRELADQ